MVSLEPITLISSSITLEPLSHNHLADLTDAVKDGELWKLWYTLIPEPQGMHQEIIRRLDLAAKGSMIPFAVIDNIRSKAIGMTNFMNIDSCHQRLEIGGTWYCKSAQGTGVKTMSKLMLLTHAFETLNCIAVEFRTHIFNHQSRRGIKKLGAKLDGILRNHMIMPNGTLRDTCVYSIIKNEWTTVKAHLNWLVKKPYTNTSGNQTK